MIPGEKKKKKTLPSRLPGFSLRKNKKAEGVSCEVLRRIVFYFKARVKGYTLGSFKLSWIRITSLNQSLKLRCVTFSSQAGKWQGALAAALKAEVTGSHGHQVPRL